MKHLFIILILLVGSIAQAEQTVPEHLQDVSVTIRSESPLGGSEGSGVIITRKIGDEKISFVLTAGHVIDNVRSVREAVDAATGQSKKVVEFRDVFIVKELTEEGRRVGELKMDAQVVRFSPSDTGEDLAVLMIRKKNFVDVSARFYLEKQIPPPGTDLYHVGSLLGQQGANSLTTGIISQVGRTYLGVVYDQSSVVAFPGSSGGGVFTRSDGLYLGMVVRGSGENFNLIVPIRRLQKWAKEVDVEFLLDDKIDPPKSIDELVKKPIEKIESLNNKPSNPDEDKEFNFLIKQYKNIFADELEMTTIIQRGGGLLD